MRCAWRTAAHGQSLTIANSRAQGSRQSGNIRLECGGINSGRAPIGARWPPDRGDAGCLLQRGRDCVKLNEVLISVGRCAVEVDQHCRGSERPRWEVLLQERVTAA